LTRSWERGKGRASVVAVSRSRWAGLLLAAALTACGGDKEKPKEGEQPAAAAKPVDGYQTSWTGYVSKTFPGALADNAEAVKSALRSLDLEITGESGGVFEKSLEAEAQDGTSLVASVKEVSKDQTRVSVKVGYLLGDKDAARRILSEVEGRIAAGKAEAEERKRRWRPSGSGVGMTATTTTTQPAKR
jgi:Protein of unknown function (DUF3568)